MVSAHRKKRLWWFAASDLPGIIKMEHVVAATTAESNSGRKTLSPASGSTNPLLIIEALGRHIGLVNSYKWPNVDTPLHGGGDTEQVYFVYDWYGFAVLIFNPFTVTE
jgi:hypothetical protein